MYVYVPHHIAYIVVTSIKGYEDRYDKWTNDTHFYFSVLRSINKLVVIVKDLDVTTDNSRPLLVGKCCMNCCFEWKGLLTV